MEKNNNRNYVSIATKVKRETLERFRIICTRMQKAPYEVLQLVVDTLVRYCDEPTSMSPDMEALIHIFEDLAGWKESFNLADPTARPTVSEATYYLTDADGERGGVRGVLVRTPFMGEADYTYNVTAILERCICLLFPSIYRRLRSAASELDTSSAVETIDRLLSDYLAGSDDRTLSSIFSDNRRSEYGRTAVDAPYVRHNRRDMETLFGNDDPAPDYDSCPDDIPLPDNEQQTTTIEDEYEAKLDAVMAEYEQRITDSAQLDDVDSIIEQIENGTL